MLRNPIFRRIRRHSSISTLFRSATPEAGSYPLSLVISPPVSYLPSLIGTEEPAEPQEMSAQPFTQPASSPGVQGEPSPASREPDLAASPHAGKSVVRQPEAPVPGTKSPPSQPAEPPKPGKWQLPAVLRKLQDRFTPQRKPVPSQEAPSGPNLDEPPRELQPLAGPLRLDPPLKPEGEIGTLPVIPGEPVHAPVEEVPSLASQIKPQAAPSQPPVQARLASPVERSPAAASTRPAAPSPQAPRAIPAPPKEPAPAAAPETDDATWRRLQAIMRKHDEIQAASGGTGEVRESAGQEQAPPPPESSMPTPSAPPETPKTGKPTPPTQPQMQAGAAAPTPGPDVEQTYVVQPEQPEEPGPVLPLEAAWPVQRKETKSPPRAITPPPAADLTQPAISTEGEDVLRQVVSQTKTSQPTDSHVEVILPRGPRPASPVIPPPASAQPVQSNEEQFEPFAGEAAEGDVPPAVLGAPVSLEPPAIAVTPPDSVQPEPVNTSRREAAAPYEPKPLGKTVQRQVETPPEASPPLPSEVSGPEDIVSTEIGPLPGDLWRLLGQPAPGQVLPAADQPPAAIQASPLDTAIRAPLDAQGMHPGSESSPMTPLPAPEMRPPGIEMPAAASPSPAASRVQRELLGQAAITQAVYTPTRPVEAAPSDEPGQIPSIQRAVSIEEVTTSVSRPPQGANEAGEGGQQLSEKELDDLARQVYAEIRQKLSIEQERTRRRMV